MTKKYREFLEKMNIISEEDFNEIISSLPEFEMENIDTYDIDDDCDFNNVSKCIINSILEENWDDVYIDDIDFNNKKFTLGDVVSLEDLEKIKNYFPKWIIDNYDELVEDLREQERAELEYKEKESILCKLKRLSLEELKEFYSKCYGNKR